MTACKITRDAFGIICAECGDECECYVCLADEGRCPCGLDSGDDGVCSDCRGDRDGDA